VRFYFEVNIPVLLPLQTREEWQSFKEFDDGAKQLPGAPMPGSHFTNVHHDDDYTWRRNFVSLFGQNGSPYAIGPLSCLSVLSLCDVGVLWPSGWMDQNET